MTDLFEPEAAAPGDGSAPPAGERPEPAKAPTDGLAADVKKQEQFSAAMREMGAAQQLGMTLEQLRAHRKAVEARVAPMDVGEVLMGRCRQEVPILPGKLTAAFRPLRTGARRYAFGRVAELKEGSNEYLQELDLCFLTFTLAKLNTTEFSDPWKKEGVDPVVYEQVRGEVARLGDQVYQFVWVHYGWFTERIANVLNIEALKNG